MPPKERKGEVGSRSASHTLPPTLFSTLKNSTGRSPFFLFGFCGSVDDRIVQLEPHMRVKTAQDPGQFLLGGFCGLVDDRIVQLEPQMC